MSTDPTYLMITDNIRDRLSKFLFKPNTEQVRNEINACVSNYLNGLKTKRIINDWELAAVSYSKRLEVTLLLRKTPQAAYITYNVQVN